MVYGCLGALLKIMLKRRPSKRFVLAESGEEVTWDTTTDNDKCLIMETSSCTSTSDTDSNASDNNKLASQTINMALLTVPQPNVTQGGGLK